MSVAIYQLEALAAPCPSGGPRPARRGRSREWGTCYDIERGGVIYYARVVGGKPFRGSTKTGDRREAAAFRDLCDARKGIGRFPVPILDAPRFADFAKR